MSEEFDQEEIQQTGAGWWIRLIGCIVYGAIIIAYAVQTLELVSWLFPADNWYMKVVTVFVCDGCATGYAFAEMLYHFRLRRSKNLVFGMWVITFVFSTAATIIQMYLSSTHTIPHAIDANIISLAYGIIIVAFVVNIVAITVIIRMEYGAAQPKRVYLDDRPKKARVQPRTTVTALGQTTQMPAIPEKTVVLTEAQLREIIQQSQKQDPR